MSTALFFLVPIGMLAVAWSLCFVGCVLQTHGEGEGTPYSNAILATTGLVAYWPLSDLLNELDTQGATSAAGDLSGNGHNGTYTIPPLYPAGQQSMQFAVPALKRETSIVPGDVSTSDQVDKNPFPASVDFEGGYVSIPWASTSPTLDQFTFEAWVQLNWSASVTGNLWVVFGAVTPTAGFVVFVNDKNNWAIAVGDGMTTNLIDTMVQAPVQPSASMPAAPTYVAVTFGPDKLLRLWVNPSSETSAPPTATWISPNPVTYIAVDPTQQPLAFFIGAGYSNQPLRTQPMVVGAPMYPFQGQIQSVALYQTALGGADLESHFEDGLSP